MTNLWPCSPQGGAVLTLGYPMQPFQGKKLKIPHRASSQHTDTLLPRLAGTRLPYEPLLIAKPGGLCELLKLGSSR